MRLVQTYVNPYKESLEVIYTMPLPADGAVIGYTITIGDRVITGEIQRLEDAREEFDRALREGRTAGLLEQSRSDIKGLYMWCADEPTRLHLLRLLEETEADGKLVPEVLITTGTRRGRMRRA